MIEKQVRYLILATLEKVYPDGLTLGFLESILTYWKIYTTQSNIRDILKPLIDKGYIEVRDVKLPAFTHHIQKVVITPTGLQILRGERIDPDVERLE